LSQLPFSNLPGIRRGTSIVSNATAAAKIQKA
jgi:hypothetical protein